MRSSRRGAGVVVILGAVALARAGSAPYGVCSDGVNFWIALNLGNKLARF